MYLRSDVTPYTLASGHNNSTFQVKNSIQ
uniref:Uncharacterized protein n=1 Tax=Anguilla anguilla TaxID=7936 RepID=A0A0E9X7J0_ANGAN